MIEGISYKLQAARPLKHLFLFTNIRREESKGQTKKRQRQVSNFKLPNSQTFFYRRERKDFSQRT